MIPSYHKLLKDPRLLRFGMNIWPPFWGAGIVIESIDPTIRHVRVALSDRVFNRNYVGTHFGGSLFAMTDPFFMLMVMRNLDHRYYVWDKAGRIEFLQPGQGRLIADMRISEEELEEIRGATAQGEKFERDFQAEIRNQAGEAIARVTKTVYVRLKPEYRPSAPQAKGRSQK